MSCAFSSAIRYRWGNLPKVEADPAKLLTSATMDTSTLMIRMLLRDDTLSHVVPPLTDVPSQPDP